MVGDLIGSGIDVHCLRDLTRGGLASALNEIVVAVEAGMAIDESVIPVLEPVRGACGLLGLDPLYVANEGRFVAMVPEPLAGKAARIGVVTEHHGQPVILQTVAGTNRILDLLSGEQLPRIC